MEDAEELVVDGRILGVLDATSEGHDARAVVVRGRSRREAAGELHRHEADGQNERGVLARKRAALAGAGEGRRVAGERLNGVGVPGVVEVAAGGIWESLYTTAFGILVAVPALIAYNYFVKRSRTEFDMLDNAANDIVAIASEFNERKKK